MKRQEVLNRLGIRIPKEAVRRVVIFTDVSNEADDPFALMHELLTPSFDIKAIIASHYETKAPKSETTMEKSYEALVRMMKAAEIDDVPLFRGVTRPLNSIDEVLPFEGMQFVIDEAKKESDEPLYLMVLGTISDVASLLNAAPEIEDRVVVIWNGGAAYPKGGKEFNMKQDLWGSRKIFDCNVDLWQIPSCITSTVTATLAELKYKLYPCSEIGKYLYDQLEEYNYKDAAIHKDIRRGENWILGDNDIAWTLMDVQSLERYDVVNAPGLNEDFTYTESTKNHPIRVYKTTDNRANLEDFFAKMYLCYHE